MSQIEKKKRRTMPSLRGLKKSRKGCFTCKKRKKKCDEIKPICSNCTRLGLECTYGIRLSWNENNQFTIDVNTEKIKKIENIKSFDLSKFIEKSSPYFINFTIWDIIASYQVSPNPSSNQLLNLNNFILEQYESETKTDEEYKYDVHKLTSSILPKPELDLLRNDTYFGPIMKEEFLFELYSEVLSCTKSFARSENLSNDFINLVIPGCKKFPALYRSVLALSALDLIKLELGKNKNERNNYLINIYNSLFIGYKNDALNFLHDILDGFDINVVEMLEELVITILLLCNIEITNRGNKEWVRYLTEASLIFNALTLEKILSSNIFIFAYKYFSLRYILLLTTLDHETMNNFLETSPWPMLDEIFMNNGIDPMFGCSAKIIDIIYKTTIYDYLYHNNEIQMHDFVAKLTRLWYLLDSIKQNGSDENDELTGSARCHLYAAKIYIYTILIRNKVEKYLDDEYDEYVPKLWEKLTYLSLSQKSLFFPNWCFFIVTTTDIFEDEDIKRIRALRLFESLQSNWPLSSVVKIRKAIESIWKVYDLSSGMSSSDISSSDKERETPFDCRKVLKEYKFMLALT
ncbi:hypothetical protein C6P40_004424 [Pichia californica]|uniref:Zn(2)-C6 fungal-type domain-containing protein n=1 Tax=Pichia californica TaxID=460514 RepID=A0A9P7BII6_9ASCO|nr:hypothetical protein C6P40_004424 [[Candida] californica]